MTPLSDRLIRVAICGAAMLVAACGGDPAPPPDSDAAPDGIVVIDDRDAEAAGIAVAPVRAVERREPLRASGVVAFDERRTARIGARLEGVVADVYVQAGDRVGDGAMLAALHSHVVHDAWADYFRALAERQRAEAELAFARTAESRAAQLVADRALSPQELERARADRIAAEQAAAAAAADLTRVEQELGHYGLTPRPDANPREDDLVPIRTPVAGAVVERHASPGAAVMPGTPLFVVSDLSRVWIDAEIDEALVGRLEVGSPVTFTTGAYGDEVFEGRLAAIGDVVNPATRRVTLRVEADNPGGRLKPNMFVALTISTGTPRQVLVVPSRAVQTLDGEPVVFVRSGTTFVRRPVAIGLEIDDEVAIERGLSEGELVATAGAFLLKSEIAGPPPGDE